MMQRMTLSIIFLSTNERKMIVQSIIIHRTLYTVQYKPAAVPDVIIVREIHVENELSLHRGKVGHSPVLGSPGHRVHWWS